MLNLPIKSMVSIPEKSSVYPRKVRNSQGSVSPENSLSGTLAQVV